MFCLNCLPFSYKPVADLGEGPGARFPPPPLFRVKKEEMTEGRKADRASKTRPGPHLSSKSGSATVSCSNLKLHQTLEVKNIFKLEKTILQITFNPGLTLTGFRTTRPWDLLKRCHRGIHQLSHSRFMRGRMYRQAYWDVPVYGEYQDLRANRIDARTVNHQGRVVQSPIKLTQG